MKKIVILLLTFLGICSGYAQNPSVSDTMTVKKITSDSLLKEKAVVKLYPNPAKNKVELQVTGFEPGLVQVQIFNVSGKAVRNDSRLLFSGNENVVVMFSLSPGIYFVVLKQKDKLVKKKMVVQ
jgi:Secretion system C-terminal sorting domain